jgi:predicted ATPase
MLFTDIEASTAAARALGADWAAALSTHHEILEQAIREQRGHVEGTEGDAFFATFILPEQALAAARAAQEALRGHAWPGTELRVRMGVHTGSLTRTPAGPVGLEIHRAARIGSAAHGRQVVVSAVTRALASDAGVFEDLGEHRLKDFPQPERLFHLVVGNLRRDGFKPLRTLPVRPTNIPALESPLIGRQDELDELGSLLTGEAHLVTMTGRGGTGKTRLALAAGTELLDAFPGGVWFVPLADTQDGDQLLAAVAAVLGVGEDPNAPVLEQIADGLRDAPVLLILDNLEQLRDAAKTVEHLLVAAPNARILATSQLPLRLTREHLMPLEPLATENGVQLFLEQAARRGGQAAADGSLAAVRAVCEQLDGLPLAIELAAARTVALTPEELLDRLGDSLRLLTSRDRDRPERQRSLRATIEWSLGLLEPEDAELFAMLSAFAGTFTLADAEALTNVDVLDGLEALVGSSFVRRIATRDHAARFTIAQALREFGREQLITHGRLEDARMAHARWVLARAQTGWDEVVADELTPSLHVEGLGEDARLAFEFLRERHPRLHLTLAGLFAGAAAEFSVLPMLTRELDHAIAAADEPGPELALAVLGAGDIRGALGGHAAAVPYLVRAHELALTHGPPIVETLALTSMSFAKLVTDPAAARPLAEQALERSAVAGGRTYALQALARVDMAEGRIEVEPLLAEMLEQERPSGGLDGLRHYYADCALLREDGPAAVERYAVALRSDVDHGPNINVGDIEGLAMALAVAGRPQDALEVDSIAQAFRAYQGRGPEGVPFWIALEERHLAPLRAAATATPDPTAITDLPAALERALRLADAALVP